MKQLTYDTGSSEYIGDKNFSVADTASANVGRAYIVYGPPDELEVHADAGYEQWYYKKIPGVGNNVIFEFGSRRARK